MAGFTPLNNCREVILFGNYKKEDVWALYAGKSDNYLTG